MQCTSNKTNDTSPQKEGAAEYSAIFDALDKQIKAEQLFRIERLTLSQLSEKLGLQQRDISRAINLNANKSFNSYINDLDNFRNLDAEKGPGNSVLIKFASNKSY